MTKPKLEVEEVQPVEEVKPIRTVNFEFNREDLNALRDSVNELVNRANK